VGPRVEEAGMKALSVGIGIRGFLLLLTAVCCLSPLVAAEPPLSVEMVESHIRKDHPRLFLTPETVPMVRLYAQTVARGYLNILLKRVDSYPKNPSLEFKNNLFDIKKGSIVFKKDLDDQNAASFIVNSTGGQEAVECALAWIITGKELYRQKAIGYLHMANMFCHWSDSHKILPEWYHYSRLCAIVAYDWIYPTLTLQQRKDFMLPMLKHVAYLQDPGYHHNAGGADTGNYGDPGLQWYAGVAAYGDGIDNPLAAKLLRAGCALNIDMMTHREKISAGSGLLASIAHEYSFVAYPWSSYNFLHSLRSAAGIDGTAYWVQMRDYANWFLWALIPADDGFMLDYGWGDAAHWTNQFNSRQMYTHLAQALHFYGKAYPDAATACRAAMAMLPRQERRLVGMPEFSVPPFVPFILTDFLPETAQETKRCELLLDREAQQFSSFGLTIMRSGFEPDDTYASFRAGGTFDTHQHYDENSFIIYKHGFQVLDSGSRGAAPHHLVYYPQTVAHNTILIRMPEEPLPPYWYPETAPVIKEKVWCDGGQYLHKAGRGLPMKQSEYHVSVGGDATAAYSPAKCREAVRQFVFVDPDFFVIYDRVTSVKPDQEKVFLLHTQNQPLEILPGLIRSEADHGVMMVHALLPEKRAVEVIGGPGKEFWTNGKNWPVYQYERMSRPNWLGRWRIEIKAAEAENAVRFLNVIQVGKTDQFKPVEFNLVRTADEDGVTFTTHEGFACRVMFRRDGPVGGKITIEHQGKKVVDEPL